MFSQHVGCYKIRHLDSKLLEFDLCNRYFVCGYQISRNNPKIPHSYWHPCSVFEMSLQVYL